MNKLLIGLTAAVMLGSAPVPPPTFPVEQGQLQYGHVIDYIMYTTGTQFEKVKADYYADRLNKS